MLTSSRWLIVGHGSLGSFVARRLVAAGADVAVFDPQPRVPITDGVAVSAVQAGVYDYVFSCVPPDVAEDVAMSVRDAVVKGGLFFDWNTASPQVKRRIAEATAVDTIDVALLDSVDGTVTRPRLAISGPQVARATALLDAGGFNVSAAGEAAGDAAGLKYVRSIFMKTLEALVLEFSALSADLDRDGIVRNSIENNLGEQFVVFMDLLVSTNRLHAERRANELADAVATFADQGKRPELAAAGVGVLRQAAEAWEHGGPPAGATPAILSAYLGTTLWREPASM